MGHSETLTGVTLLIIAAITAGNAAVVVSARSTLKDCAPDYITVYFDVMSALMVVSALFLFVTAGLMCKRGLPEPKERITLVPECPCTNNASNLPWTFRTKEALREGWAWLLRMTTVFPLFCSHTTTPLNVPPDVSIQSRAAV
jgi:hypothetical protein